MFKTILVPTDGSALAQQAISAALTFAGMHNSKIIALGVAETRLFQSTRQQADADGAAVESGNRADAARWVDDVAQQARQLHIACETAIAQSSLPAQEIASAARQFGCDVIFMATRSEMGVLDTALGESQTQQVLRTVAIPVLVFPHPQN